MVLSDLQGAWQLLRTTVVEQHPARVREWLLLPIEEGMSWDNVWNLAYIRATLRLIRPMVIEANLPQAVKDKIDIVRHVWIFVPIDPSEGLDAANAPWLYPTYAPIVFQTNYHYLREMETIVAHDYVFQLKTMQDGTVLVEETTNATARCLALYEMQTFKAIVTRCMPMFAS
jgi:hypothetical protein